MKIAQLSPNPGQALSHLHNSATTRAKDLVPKTKIIVKVKYKNKNKIKIAQLKSKAKLSLILPS